MFILVGAAACAAPVFWYGVIPYPWTLAGTNPERTALMEQRVQDARNQDAPFELRQEWARLDEISPNLVRAVLTAEDYRFREHRGIDWVSLAEEVHWTGDEDFSLWSLADVRALIAAVGYVRANRDSVRGRSTITQQLAKNLYFGAERTFARKALEFVVAGRLERRLGKDRILELYLNVAEWGPGVFGASARISGDPHLPLPSTRRLLWPRRSLTRSPRIPLTAHHGCAGART
ncbi:MAG: transglycosylase domain-containing protein [Gemmatimonadetes bacterium]|nr:transglycosylase domain-containing protein [Gemmatimonadota bacterium]MDA1104381.1 transglycosylase domain-containing protein [Gemmatimonadota bacterium]